MVMEEEQMASKMIQRMVRARLARNQFRRILTEVYSKVYDKKTKQVRYVDNRTGIASETKPILLLLLQCDGQERSDPLLPEDAAIRIQHCVRTRQARLHLKELVRDLYQKHLDPETKEYYYLNTQTKQISHTKPVFLGVEDIPVERFIYRNAACRLSTKANMIGNGVLIQFHNVLCILTDHVTLPDQETARFSRVQFNHRQGSIAFLVRLRSDLFFITSTFASYQCDADPSLDFSICAIDAEEFRKAAGDSVRGILRSRLNDVIFEQVEPIQIAFTDRRMACAQDVRRHEEIEIVGHPHGKLAQVHRGFVAKCIPNMVKPKRLEYQNEFPSGASGSPIFNFGGRLLGIHHQPTLKDAANQCSLVKPIIEFTKAQIQPPAPLLLSTCLTHDTVNIYWQVPPQYKPWNGLQLEFTLEMCNRTLRGTKGYYDRFQVVYTGPKTTFTVLGLIPVTKYAFRCRSVHFMAKGNWCAPMQITTLPAATRAWQVEYCSSITAAVEYVTKSKDALVHRQSIQWLQARAVEITPSSDAWTSEIEPELMACHTGSIIRQSLEMFRHLDDHAFDCLDVLVHFAQFQTIFRNQMVDVDTFEWLVHHLFPHYSSVPRVIEKAMAFLGYLVKDNEVGKEIFLAVQGIPIVLERIEQYLTVEGVVREACYVLAAACHNFRPSQLQIGVNLGMKVIARVFLAFPYHPQVLYWACLTLGNAACGYEPNQIRGQKYKIVDCIVAMKIKFILKLNALGDAIEKETNILETLAATAIGEEVRNEMDSHELRRQSLIAIQSFMKSENVLGVANYALEYMMNDQQKQIQARTKHLATRLVSIRLSAALIHWQNQTNKVFMGRMLHRVLGGMAAKLLYSALRKWEQSMRELRMEQSTLAYRANKGLILDLRKSKKAERYRLLVQSK